MNATGRTNKRLPDSEYVAAVAALSPARKWVRVAAVACRLGVCGATARSRLLNLVGLGVLETAQPAGRGRVLLVREPPTPESLRADSEAAKAELSKYAQWPARPPGYSPIQWRIFQLRCQLEWVRELAAEERADAERAAAVEPGGSHI